VALGRSAGSRRAGVVFGDCFGFSYSCTCAGGLADFCYVLLGAAIFCFFEPLSLFVRAWLFPSGEYKVIVPDHYHTGHEAHFAEVTKKLPALLSDRLLTALGGSQYAYQILHHHGGLEDG